MADASGTRIILQLKEDEVTYSESSKLEELPNRYSEFIEFPISLWKESTTYEKVPDPKMKTVPITTSNFNRMNHQKLTWFRSPNDVTEDEFNKFYKSATVHPMTNLKNEVTSPWRDK